ncbi:MAG: acetyl-CoA carboxylase biotin carboxyl carrier protein subunit, partial [Terriglobia bacterium]
PVAMNAHDILEIAPGVYSILVDGSSFEARVSGDRIEIEGHYFPILAEDPRRWRGAVPAAAHEGRAVLTASMPGKVVRVLVELGQDVEAGQGVVILEAMKMQNELKSPRAGRVTSLNVKLNDSVVAGATLATIEQAG